MARSAALSAPENSLVLGILTTLAPEYARPFSDSLRATGFQGTFCIVTAGYPVQQRHALTSLADDVYDVDCATADLSRSSALPLLRRVRGTRGLRRLYPPLFEIVARGGSERTSLSRWQSLEYHLEGLQALRYAHYYRYLTVNAPAADQIMISDLRDVVFQRDPFEARVTGLEVYLEEDHIRLGHDHFNTSWMRDLYGPTTITAFRNSPISCSGTVMGDRESMLSYLTEMMMEINWRRRPLGPHDQAVHNRILQAKRLANVTVVPNGSGRVLTMGGMASYATADDGAILNADRSIPAVLHQYDRHPELAERFR
jgi:hypothetical protein